MKDGARELKVRGLNDLSAPELEHRVDGEDDLEEWEGFSRRVVLKDVLASYSKEGDELRSIGKKVWAVEGGVREGGGDIRMLNGSEVPEPPEVEGGIWERWIGECEVTRSGVWRVGGRSTH